MKSESVLGRFPFGVLIGVAVGIALGVSLGSLPIGIGVGAGLAVLFGLLCQRLRSPS